MHYSPAGSSGHMISQARILEWIARPSSRDLLAPGIEPRLLHWAGFLLILKEEQNPALLTELLSSPLTNWNTIWSGGSKNLHKTKKTFWEIKCQDLSNFLPGSKLLKHLNIWGEDRGCPWPKPMDRKALPSPLRSKSPWVRWRILFLDLPKS